MLSSKGFSKVPFIFALGFGMTLLVISVVLRGQQSGSDPSPIVSPVPIGLAGDKEVRGGLVPGYPDFPTPPNTEVVRSRSATDDQGKHYDVTFEAHSPAPEVREWYIRELKAQGWTMGSYEGDIEGDEESLVFTKGTLKAGIALDKDSKDETEIVVSITVPQ